MSITITLAPTLIAIIFYTIITAMMSFPLVLDEYLLVNSNYHQAIITGIFWPVVIINLITGKLFDIWRKLTDNHKN